MNQAARPGFGPLPAILRPFVRPLRTNSIDGAKLQGHGENIWVFAHRRSDQVVYSFNKKLDGFHDLKQLPFNGKKTKPAKLRKDYWSPLAHIQFQPGQGSIGRSVFQKLRELKHLHEVSWSHELRLKRPEQFSKADKKKIAEEKDKGNDYKPIRSKEERGAALNAQKKNAIADIAAVLAGEGRGNKVVASEAEDGVKNLAGVTVSWANDQDKQYAETWSKNVTHSLLDEPAYDSGEIEAAPTPKQVEAAT